MKSFFRFCLLACIPFFNFACSGTEKLQGNEFLIEGKISGVNGNVDINLYREDGTQIASDKLIDGRFKFKEEALSETERMSIYAIGDGFPSSSLIIWVVPGAKIKIKGNGKLHPLWEVESSVPYQQEENLYTNNNRDIIAEISRLNIEKDVLRKARSASSGDKAIAYKAAVDSVDAIYDALRYKQYFSYMDIMEKTDISPVWLDKMEVIASILRYSDNGNENYGEHRKKAEELYNKISDENKNTSTGYKITAKLFPPPTVGVGDNMVDGDFFDIDGNTKHLSDYLGKYLLLDFWSLGCGPCIMALPEMKEVSEIYHDKLTIVSISLDNDAVWKKAMSAHNMPWVNIRDPKGMGGLAANYDVNAIPNYVMLSQEGKVVDKWAGFGSGYLKTKVSENIK